MVVVNLLKLPWLLVQALAEGVALGLEICYPRDDLPTYADLLAEREAEDEAWEENELRAQTTPADDEQSAQTPPVGVSPGEVTAPSATSPGHPRPEFIGAAAYWLRKFGAEEGMEEYFNFIADGLYAH